MTGSEGVCVSGFMKTWRADHACAGVRQGEEHRFRSVSLRICARACLKMFIFVEKPATRRQNVSLQRFFMLVRTWKNGNATLFVGRFFSVLAYV